MDILEKETGVALSWLEQNEMFANPEKVHAILLSEEDSEKNVALKKVEGRN